MTTRPTRHGVLPLLLFAGCGDHPVPPARPEARSEPVRPLCVEGPEAAELESDESLPKHLRRWPGLYERKGEAIVDAESADVAVARGYPAWKDKGTAKAGRRITIMTRCSRYRVGEPVRVLHVLEAQDAGHQVGVMGPKAVHAELVDGHVATSSARSSSYDGAVLESPAVDYNYDITEYVFDQPGPHTIVWNLDQNALQAQLGLESNVLQLDIAAN